MMSEIDEEIRKVMLELEERISKLESIVAFYRQRDRKDVFDEQHIKLVMKERQNEFKSANQLSLEDDIRQGRFKTVEEFIDDPRNG